MIDAIRFYNIFKNAVILPTSSSCQQQPVKQAATVHLLHEPQGRGYRELLRPLRHSLHEGRHSLERNRKNRSGQGQLEPHFQDQFPNNLLL